MTPRPPALVSVIVPVHNGEDCIENAVRSALNQDYPQVEVVVVDDGSTDGTRDRLSRIKDPRLTCVTTPNRGAAAARNSGAARAAGNYLAFLDADDLWFPSFLSRAMAALKTAPSENAFAYGGYYCVDRTRQLIKRSRVEQARGDLFPSVIQKEGLLLNTVSMMHRSVYEQAGGFPESLRYHEDRVFYLRAARHAYACPIGQRLSIYRQSTGGKARRILSDAPTAIDAATCLASALDHELPPAMREALYRTSWHGLFCRFLMYGFPQSARELLPRIERGALLKSPKGALALLSISTGVNVLQAGRRLQQATYKACMQRWWKRHSGDAYRASASPHLEQGNDT